MGVTARWRRRAWEIGSERIEYGTTTAEGPRVLRGNTESRASGRTH